VPSVFKVRLNYEELCKVANYMVHIKGLPVVIAPHIVDWWFSGHYVRINFRDSYIESDSKTIIDTIIGNAKKVRVPNYIRCP